MLYKNNTDNKGASYGAPRELPDAALDAVRRHRAAPDAVLRQPPGRRAAPGRVGIGQDGREHGFQISQRADFFEVEVGLETTLKRPIINTRDEPHADPEKYRRLHVIIGDANLAEVSTYLKVGTTALVLAMIEDALPQPPTSASSSPVAALRAVSHDPTLQHLLTLRDGRKLTARPAPDGVPRPGAQVRRGPARRRRRRADRDVLARWESVLDRLERDPMLCAARARLGGQAEAARAVPRPRRAGLGRRQAAR